MLRISIKTNNAAFADSSTGTECARILRELADRIADRNLTRGDKFPLIDINGNTVGYASVPLRD